MSNQTFSSLVSNILKGLIILVAVGVNWLVLSLFNDNVTFIETVMWLLIFIFISLIAKVNIPIKNKFLKFITDIVIQIGLVFITFYFLVSKLIEFPLNDIKLIILSSIIGALAVNMKWLFYFKQLIIEKVFSNPNSDKFNPIKFSRTMLILTSVFIILGFVLKLFLLTYALEIVSIAITLLTLIRGLLAYLIVNIAINFKVSISID